VVPAGSQQVADSLSQNLHSPPLQCNWPIVSISLMGEKCRPKTHSSNLNMKVYISILITNPRPSGAWQSINSSIMFGANPSKHIQMHTCAAQCIHAHSVHTQARPYKLSTCSSCNFSLECPTKFGENLSNNVRMRTWVRICTHARARAHTRMYTYFLWPNVSTNFWESPSHGMRTRTPVYYTHSHIARIVCKRKLERKGPIIMYF
jgi:hypothetical protein